MYIVGSEHEYSRVHQEASRIYGKPLTPHRLITYPTMVSFFKSATCSRANRMVCENGFVIFTCSRTTARKLVYHKNIKKDVLYIMGDWIYVSNFEAGMEQIESGFEEMIDAFGEDNHFGDLGENFAEIENSFKRSEFPLLLKWIKLSVENNNPNHEQRPLLWTSRLLIVTLKDAKTLFYYNKNNGIKPLKAKKIEAIAKSYGFMDDLRKQRILPPGVYAPGVYPAPRQIDPEAYAQQFVVRPPERERPIPVREEQVEQVVRQVRQDEIPQWNPDAQARDREGIRVMEHRAPAYHYNYDEA